MTAFVNSYGRILITRPTEQGQEFAKRVRSRLGGAEPDPFVLLPFMVLEDAAYSPPDASGFDGLIFSSSNGVRFFAEGAGASFSDLPVYIVGPGTARQAHALGFHNIKFTAQNAGELSAFLSELSVPGGDRFNLLFVRGEDVKTDFASVLDPARFCVQSLVVYRARAVDWPPGDAEALLEGPKIGAVTFFSERTVRLFIKNAKTAPALLNLKKAEALCISKDVLEAVRPFWEGPLYAAPSPDQDGMADLVLGRLYGQDCI